MRLKFLGTSSDMSIPREDCHCSQCKSTDKKDKRSRSSILIDKKILVDAGPDIRHQLRSNQIKNLEAVLITHEHFDHTGGIKDLLRIKDNLRIIRLKSGGHFKLLGVDLYAFRVKHSEMVPTVGLMADNLIYIPDSSDLSTAIKYFKDVKVAVLDGSTFARSFGGHLSMNEIISKVIKFKNLKRIYFTHNGHTRKTHKQMLKLIKSTGDERFLLAYDGLEITIKPI